MRKLEAGRRIRELREFFRSYAGGVGSADLERLFKRDAADAYKVLAGHDEATSDDLKGFLVQVKRLFLGLSYRLSPARRVLFALAMVTAVVGALDPAISFPGDRVVIDYSPALLLTSVGILIFLLALELVDRVRVRDELEVARALQQQLLPQESPACPGYAFAHSYRTANEIGGDYYDFLTLPDGRLALVAGDASGHGLAAGLLMVIANSTLRLAVDLDPSPAPVARMLNKVLWDTGGRRSFMTVFYGILEPTSGALEYVCNGHPFPLLRHPGGAVEELGRGALPLGLRPAAELHPAHAVIEPGDLLLLYSDGLPEAVNPENGRTFGFERLRELVVPGGTPGQVHDRIRDAFDAFMGGEPHGDDISLVVIGREARVR